MKTLSRKAKMARWAHTMRAPAEYNPQYVPALDDEFDEDGDRINTIRDLSSVIGDERLTQETIHYE